jgi:hypothetical protein
MSQATIPHDCIILTEAARQAGVTVPSFHGWLKSHDKWRGTRGRYSIVKKTDLAEYIASREARGLAQAVKNNTTTLALDEPQDIEITALSLETEDEPEETEFTADDIVQEIAQTKPEIVAELPRLEIQPSNIGPEFAQARAQVRHHYGRVTHLMDALAVKIADLKDEYALLELERDEYGSKLQQMDEMEAWMATLGK